MSLYDECETSKQIQSQPWTPAGISFLETHLRTRKASGGKPGKATSTLAPVIDLQTRNKTKPTLKNTEKSKRKIFFLGPEHDWGYENEYDPANFCNYYKIHEELEEWRAKQERQKALLENQRKQESVSPASVSPPQGKLCKNFLSNYGYDSDDSESGDERDSNAGSLPQRRGAEFAPPPSLLESTPVQRDLNTSATATATSTRSGEDVAAKIMAKYGFREGHGLGKDEQGMATALQVERTVRNCGRILHEKDLMPPPMQTPAKSVIDLLKNASKVILLSNVVGPGEVDDELEGEIKDECNKKYGEVVRVLIYERKQISAEEAVRVFVEFKRTEVATKALVDLNGRYFGGRTIKAQFYNFDRYKIFKLDD